MRFTFFFFLYSTFAFTQVGVNTTTPNAALDVNSTTQGVLISRVALTSLDVALPVVNPQGGVLANGTLVFNTATAGTAPNNVRPGFYYWDATSTKWIGISSDTNNTDWHLSGNTGTNPSTNFIGTTDAQDLVVKTNATEKMRVTSAGNVGIGSTNPTSKLEVTNPIGETNIIGLSVVNADANAKSATSIIGAGTSALDVGNWDNTVAKWAFRAYRNSDRTITDASISSAVQIFGIRADGNVGIGTNNPTSKLHLFSDFTNELKIEGSSPGYTNSQIKLVANHSTNGRGLGVFMNDTNGANTWFAGRPYGNNDKFVINRNIDNTLYTEASAITNGMGNPTPTQNFFTILNNGNTGIGTINPSAKLDIANNVTNYNSLNIEAGTTKISLYEDTDLPNFFQFRRIAGNGFIFSTQADVPNFVVRDNGNIGIGTTTPVGKFSNSTINYGAFGMGLINTESLNWEKSSTGNGWAATISSKGYHGLLVSTEGSTSNEFPLLVTSGAYNTTLGTRTNDNLFAVKGNGYVGIGTSNPASPLHVNSFMDAGLNSPSDAAAIVVGSYTGSHLEFDDNEIHSMNGLNSQELYLNADGGKVSVHGNIAGTQVTILDNGNLGIGTSNPFQKLHVEGNIQMVDGNQANNKVMVSDANGKASWSNLPISNHPIQSIGNLPVGATCPAGGNYITSSIALPAGVYIYTSYSCNGQIGASVSGFNVDIIFNSGSGDAIGTWHNFNTGVAGGCGTYYTGVVRCYTDCTVSKRYSSYSGSTFTVPGANSEYTNFVKIL